MYPFSHHKPKTLKDALALLCQGEDAALLAGGMTLIPALKLRLASYSDLVDLNEIEELAGITVSGESVRIGAMTRHAEVAESQTIRARIPALAELAGSIGDAQVRNRGTIGGSCANADPAADYPAALLGLGAEVITNRRHIAADDFFLDVFETALEPDEMITAVTFPIPFRAAYHRFSSLASRFPVVGVMVAETNSGIRVAVTGAGPKAFRLSAMEAALAANFSDTSLEGIAIPADGLNDDLHGSATYRAHLIGVMAGRAVRSIL